MTAKTVTTEVTIIVKRDGDSKTYQLSELGDSKKGTFKKFGVPAENADFPSFAQLYVKVKRDVPKPAAKANGKK